MATQQRGTRKSKHRKHGTWRSSVTIKMAELSSENIENRPKSRDVTKSTAGGAGASHSELKRGKKIYFGRIMHVHCLRQRHRASN